MLPHLGHVDSVVVVMSASGSGFGKIVVVTSAVDCLSVERAASSTVVLHASKPSNQVCSNFKSPGLPH